MMANDKNAVPNPWFDYRNAWTSREAAARSRERMWQIVALLSVVVSILSLGGFIYHANSSKYVPYVVEVDKLGAAMGVQPASLVKFADPRVVKYSIASFISESRVVSPDVNIQRRAIFRVYAMLNENDIARTKMTEYVNGNPETSPFRRAQTVTVETEIVSMIPQTETSWEVDWVETIRDRKTGTISDQYRMRATISYYVAAVGSQTEESLLYNPLGLFIQDYNWGRIQESTTNK